jgi:hypothetical protein
MLTTAAAAEIEGAEGEGAAAARVGGAGWCGAGSHLILNYSSQLRKSVSITRKKGEVTVNSAARRK